MYVFICMPSVTTGGLCQDPVEDARRADCGHVFCRTCVGDYLETVLGEGDQDQGSDVMIDDEEEEEEEVYNGEEEASAGRKRKGSKAKNKEGNGKGGRGKKRREESKKASSLTSCPCCDQPLSVDLEKAIDVTAIEAAQPNQANATVGSSNSSSYIPIARPLLSSSAVRQGGRRRKSILDKIDQKQFHSSSKIEALMQELHAMQQNDLGAKAIVFSQFTSMLDIIEHRISNDRYSSGYDVGSSNSSMSGSAVPRLRCAMIMGNMSIDQRDNIVKAFNSDPDLKVLLISLKAGGVALNLTVASHIHIMDPWWNPAAEMQVRE